MCTARNHVTGRSRMNDGTLKLQVMRSGIKVLEDVPGTGPTIQRQRFYRIRVRMWLNKGDAVRWRSPWGSIQRAILEDEGRTLVTDVRVDRVFLISGLFYGIAGMRVGAVRKLTIASHLGYGERGVPEEIPPHSVLTAEVAILQENQTDRS